MSNEFPAELNDWQDGELIESGWADSIETKIGKDNSADTSSFDYRIRQLEAYVNEEVPARVSATSYTLAFAPVTATMQLYLDGFRLRRGVDYTLGGTGNQTITLLVNNGAGITTDSVLLADYLKVLSQWYNKFI